MESVRKKKQAALRAVLCTAERQATEKKATLVISNQDSKHSSLASIGTKVGTKAKQMTKYSDWINEASRKA